MMRVARPAPMPGRRSSSANIAVLMLTRAVALAPCWTSFAVGRADETFALHHVEDGGSAPVANAQAALQDGGRSLLHLDADAQRVLEQLVALAAAYLTARRLFFRLRDRLVIDGQALQLD